MRLTKEEIENIAKLSRLNLTEEEKKRYGKELSVVLDYVNLLNEVETDGVEETSQVTGLQNVFREDVVINCDNDTKEKLLAQFPEKEGELLKVPNVFE